jgi:hypothetical protein
MKTWLIPFILIATGCGGTPTAPTPPLTPSLSVDNATFVVGRHESGQLHASFGIPGAQQDVTAAASWTSSNAAVATVNGGLVTAVTLGTATVTVDYQGQHQTSAVTVRRRTRLIGTIRINDANGLRTIQTLESFVDDKEAGYTGYSGALTSGCYTGYSGALTSGSVSWKLAYEWVVDPIVPPGGNTVAVEIFQNNPPNSYTSDSSSELTVQDIDTHETLGHIALPVQSVTSLPNMGKITWTVQVDTYSK